MAVPRPRTKDPERNSQQRRRDAAPPSIPRLTRRRVGRRSLVATGAGVVVVGGILVAALLVGGGNAPQATPASSGKLATVERTDLVSVSTFSGTVDAQAGPAVVNRLNGTITGETTEGTTVKRGGGLYFVDGLPVLLFYGTVPAWRDIGPGVSDGVDVKQLEENLDALGFDPGIIDDHFTSSTQSAIENWQDSLGLAKDGVVRLGRIIFAPGALKVDQLSKTTGSPTHDGDTIMTTLSDSRVVTVPVDSSAQVALQSGDNVSIVRPDGSKVAGTVTAISASQASGDQGSGNNTTQDATVEPKRASDLAALRDGTSVDVELQDDARKGVLAVPVTALVARSTGGYAVEVVRGGATEFVTVTPGLYADDLVEISGNVREGDKVVVP
jgi:membrane fusion protein, multidrug efflux system